MQSTTDDSEDLNLEISDDDDWAVIRDKGKVHNLNFEEYVTIDDEVATSSFREVDDILMDNAVRSDDDSDADDRNAAPEDEVLVPSRTEALQAINLLRRYMATVPNAFCDAVPDVHKLENFIVTNSFSKTRQSQITDFTTVCTV